MGTLQSVDLVDPVTVRFNFSQPYAPFFTNISLGYGGIVSPDRRQEIRRRFGHNPVGVGPLQAQGVGHRTADHARTQPGLQELPHGRAEHRPGVPRRDRVQGHSGPGDPTGGIAERRAGRERRGRSAGRQDQERPQVPDRDLERRDGHELHRVRQQGAVHGPRGAARRSRTRSTATRLSRAPGTATPTANLNPQPTGVAGWDASDRPAVRLRVQPRQSQEGARGRRLYRRAGWRAAEGWQAARVHDARLLGQPARPRRRPRLFRRRCSPSG